MGVYIDRDELLELYANTDDLDISDYDVKVAVIRQNILDMPAIDIVRCGECKWWEKMKDSYFGYCHAEKHCHFSNNWEISIYRTYKADHFCSDGERRTNEHNQ